MLTWWLASVALAAQTTPIVPEAAEMYEEAASMLLDGPPGCWEVVGRASYHWDGGKAGFTRGDSAFVARLEDGVWVDFVIRSLGEDTRTRRSFTRRIYPHDTLRFVPLVGRRTAIRPVPASGGVADDVLVSLVDHLSGVVSSAWSDWDGLSNSVVLHRTIPFGDGSGAAEATMHVLFPEGRLHPERVRITFPERFSLPDARLASVTGATATIRAIVVDDMVFPSAEVVSFEIGGLRGSGVASQTIRYTSFRPCGGDAHAADRPITGAP